jgi:hypothetical protein
VADAKGREHECILKILILAMPESTSESDSSQGKHWVWIVFYHYLCCNPIDSSDDDESDEDSADFDDYSDNEDDEEEDMN